MKNLVSYWLWRTSFYSRRFIRHWFTTLSTKEGFRLQFENCSIRVWRFRLAWWHWGETTRFQYYKKGQIISEYLYYKQPQYKSGWVSHN